LAPPGQKDAICDPLTVPPAGNLACCSTLFPGAAIGASLGIDVPLAAWFIAWPMAKLAGLIPVSLGGLAVREAALASLLLPFGVPASQGVAASLLWQTILIAGGLLAGLTWLVLRRVQHDPVAPATDTGIERKGHV
jgi:uncharacterized membrane protein YbhN (UPF0104 family)